jgi:hypothetical protein
LAAATNAEKAYAELVQRILLARAYVNSHPGKYIPVPTGWFSIANQNGFAGTEKWFTGIQATRASLPLYKLELKAFAEAVQEISEHAGATTFHYWRNYFIERNCQGLLNLFLSTVANFVYSIDEE